MAMTSILTKTGVVKCHESKLDVEVKVDDKPLPRGQKII